MYINTIYASMYHVFSRQSYMWAEQFLLWLKYTFITISCRHYTFQRETFGSDFTVKFRHVFFKNCDRLANSSALKIIQQNQDFTRLQTVVHLLNIHRWRRGCGCHCFLMSTSLILGDSSVKFYFTSCFCWFDFLSTMSLCFWMFLVSM